MNLIQSILLAIVQGIAEFLPISSSGHLNLLQHFLGLTPSLTFDIFLNTATLLSVLFFFRKKLSYFFSNLPQIIIGSIPAAFVGIFFKDQIESIFADISLLPLFFLFTATFLFITKYLPVKNNKLTYRHAFIIGLFQAFAILPAVSRSGSTIFAGLLLGLSPLQAFNFSFALFIPASLGALLLDLKKLSDLNLTNPVYIISFIITFMVGVLALTLLQKILVNQKIWVFGVYALLLSIVLMFVL